MQFIVHMTRETRKYLPELVNDRIGQNVIIVQRVTVMLSCYPALFPLVGNSLPTYNKKENSTTQTSNKY